MFSKRLEGVGDFSRLAPTHTVVVTPLVKAPLVLEAKEHMDGAVAVGDQDRVVQSDPVGIDPESQGCRILSLFTLKLDNLFCRTPGFTAIG